MPRLMIEITTDVRDALNRIAQAEERNPRRQAALILRQHLEAAGYLQPARPEPPAAREQPRPCAP